ncbi:MAG: hypothetical protein ACTSRG_26950 [Candidatus Helarchaeota archaeon]
MSDENKCGMTLDDRVNALEREFGKDSVSVLNKRIEELEKKIDLIDTIATSTAIGTDLHPKRIENLENVLRDLLEELQWHSSEKLQNVLNELLAKLDVENEEDEE